VILVFFHLHYPDYVADRVASNGKEEDELRDKIAAAVKYHRIQKHDVWIVFRYVGEKIRPCERLKYTSKRD
jgi:hypothetical protein